MCSVLSGKGDLCTPLSESGGLGGLEKEKERRAAGKEGERVEEERDRKNEQANS